MHATHRRETKGDDAERDDLQRFPAQEDVGTHGHPDACAQKERHGIDEFVLCHVRQTFHHTAFPKQIPPHEHGQ